MTYIFIWNGKNMIIKNYAQKIQSLYYAKDNRLYVIADVPDLGILRSLGIVKNAIIYKKMTHKFGGPVLLMIDSSQIAIGKDIAEKIYVRG